MKIIGAKTCPKCLEMKPLEEFGIDRSKPTGRRTYCRPCARELYRNNPMMAVSRRRYAEEHREEKKEYAARYREKNKVRLNAQIRQRRLNNLEQYRKRERQRYEEHIEERRAAARAFRDKANWAFEELRRLGYKGV